MTPVSYATFLRVRLITTIMNLNASQRVYCRDAEGTAVPLSAPLGHHVATEITKSVVSLANGDSYSHLESNELGSLLRRGVRSILFSNGVVEKERGAALDDLLETIATTADTIRGTQL